jgi:phosphoglycolate phosphatase
VNAEAVLFDLDGTLVHTAPCITAALNQSLEDNGLGGLEQADVTAMIGGGVPTLIQRALTKLGTAPRPELLAALLTRYREVYLGPTSPTPHSFSGVEQALIELHGEGLKLGVVTNTFDRFVHTILKRAKLSHLFDVIVSADSIPERKPHPAPLLHACNALAIAPALTLFVGDSSNDAEAAQAAHLPMVCMTYGYNEGKPVSALPCIAFLDDMAELPELVRALRITST